MGFRFGYSRYIPIIRRLIFRRDDKSVFFGDSTHHCLVYYFHLKASLLTQKRSCGKYLINGWKWILEKLKENSDGGKAFDFSWEPRPHRPRFCNFQDTNTYFLILASIPLMSKLGLEEENLE
ncbi:hypothetical protein H8E88_26285 [candidate division KSB1 bacterium]|nr:hypothetical protein [candidate division KSB1 bacterium]